MVLESKMIEHWEQVVLKPLMLIESVLISESCVTRKVILAG